MACVYRLPSISAPLLIHLEVAVAWITTELCREEQGSGGMTKAFRQARSTALPGFPLVPRVAKLLAQAPRQRRIIWCGRGRTLVLRRTLLPSSSRTRPRASMDAPVPVGQFAMDAVERVRVKAAAPRRAIALRGRITRERFCAGRSSSAAGTQRHTSDNNITRIAVQGDNA